MTRRTRVKPELVVLIQTLLKLAQQHFQEHLSNKSVPLLTNMRLDSGVCCAVRVFQFQGLVGNAGEFAQTLFQRSSFKLSQL